MAKLATGSGIAQILGVVTAPIITRIYLPEHLGVLSVFTALVGLLIPLGTLRYCMAIPLPKSDATATNLAVLAATSLLIVSTLSLAIFWIFGPFILQQLSMEQLLPYWWLIPTAIVGTGFYQLLTNWAVREKAFKPLAQTKVWQKIIGSVVKVGLGFAGIKPLGLLIGQIFTQAGGILSLFRCFRKKISDNLRHVTRYRIAFLFKRYADFPKFRLPSQFLLVLATKAPLLFFAWHFGADTTGQLGLALMILALPIGLFGQSIGQAYYAEVAKIGKKNPKKILNITTSITKKLFLVSIPFVLILLLFGPLLFQFAFGEVWREAGLMASILSIYLLSQFLSNPITNALNVFEKQHYYLYINIIRFFLLSIVFCISFVFALSHYWTLVFYSLVMTIFRLMVFLTIIRVMRY
jgi:O-antigen/teichoic acid export membrane protein